MRVRGRGCACVWVRTAFYIVDRRTPNDRNAVMGFFRGFPLVFGPGAFWKVSILVDVACRFDGSVT